ncbi:MAG TPA: MlaD family protein [Usitatibacter sp.]|jgi:paraquat-inducible protein B|nr:MlaD family protein [Usitatibacter sp.]
MPETPPPADPQHEPLPEALPRKPSPRSLQLVWVIPVVAAIVGGWLAAKALFDHGPTIQIHFETAEGLEAGKTRIKYKDVDIGIVRAIELSEDRKDAIVHAELARRGSRGFLADDTRFWIVRPRFTGGYVTGLSTLLAGAYIGADPGKSNNETHEFKGLETPPVVTSGQPGRMFTLSAEDLGSIDVGSPVYYRSVNAGRVVSVELSKDGRHVQVGIFLTPPFDRFVTGGSRFWNASGVDLSVSSDGLKMNSEGLITVLLGGIAFETPDEAQSLPPAGPNTTFILWKTRDDAQKPRETVIETYLLTFAQSVRGLGVGAPVDFRGITVGEVKSIDLTYDPKTVRFRTAVEVLLFPERMRSREARLSGKPFAPADRFQRFVEHGLRGQLRSGNLLTGQMYVALEFFPDAPKATIDRSKNPPEIPTVSGGLSELQETLANIVKRLDKIPFDRIGEDLRQALEKLNRTLEKADVLVAKMNNEIAPELKEAIAQAKKTLAAAERTVAAAERTVAPDSPLQDDLRETLQEVTKSAESLRALVDYLERHPESLIRGKRAEEKK